MQTNMMHNLLLNTYQEFVKALEIHTNFLPSSDLLNDDVIDIPLKENRSETDRIQVFISIHFHDTFQIILRWPTSKYVPLIHICYSHRTSWWIY